MITPDLIKEDKFLDDFNQMDFTYLENSDLDVNNTFDRFLKYLIL